MAEKKLSPIEQWYEVCKKKGRVYTSEEHRARGFEYMKPYYNRESYHRYHRTLGGRHR